MLKLAFHILCFTSRVLSQIWSDTYLHCWRRWCCSLSALLIQRHAREISALLLLRACISTSPFQGHISGKLPSTSLQKARVRHEMGFIGEQLHLLAYLKTRSMLSNGVKRLAKCAESILISSSLPSQQQALSKWQSNFASIRKWLTSSPNWKAEDGTADGSLPPSEHSEWDAHCAGWKKSKYWRRNSISDSSPAIRRALIRPLPTPSHLPTANTFSDIHTGLCLQSFSIISPFHCLFLSHAERMQCSRAQSRGNTCRHLCCHLWKRMCLALCVKCGYMTDNPALSSAAICWWIYELKSTLQLMSMTWFIHHKISRWVNKHIAVSRTSFLTYEKQEHAIRQLCN